MTNATPSPRLYVGTYAKYNAGSLAGAWLDLDDYADADDFYAACRALHSDEAEPELMFQDFEGFPRSLYSECDAGPVYDWLEVVNASHLSAEVFEAAAALDIPANEVEESYQGEYSSDEEFAQELAEELGAIDHDATWPMNCIDWKKAARELMYDYVEEEGHYFRR